MTTEERNREFAEHEALIGHTVRRNRPLLARLRMDADDMAQELAVVLLKAIGTYNPDRGCKPKTYYSKILQYGVLKINRAAHRGRRLANLTAGPLVAVNADGVETEIDVPVWVDFDSGPIVGEFLGKLSERERGVVATGLAGGRLTDARRKKWMGLVKRKAARAIATGGL
jgi:DNA-directed RNA polymerase specialized sigma24 family protein